MNPKHSGMAFSGNPETAGRARVTLATGLGTLPSWVCLAVFKGLQLSDRPWVEKRHPVSHLDSTGARPHTPKRDKEQPAGASELRTVAQASPVDIDALEGRGMEGTKTRRPPNGKSVPPSMYLAPLQYMFPSRTG